MARTWRSGVTAALTAIALGGAGCVDTLPDEDLRITTTPPVAKLSVALLWKEHQDDAAAARDRYWGRAVEVSGLVTRVSEPNTPDPHVMFVQQDEHGVKARLIAERAGEVLAAAKPGERLTLKCFCDQMTGGDLLLKSCVRP